MRTTLSLLLAAYGWLPGSLLAEAAPDRLAEALASVGMTKADLGFRPRGYWSRYPDPQRIPHKLHFFDSLFAEPLRTYDFTRVMAQATADLLSGKQVREQKDALFRLAFFLGIDHKVGVFRGYSANLDPQLPEKGPLLAAAERAYRAAGQSMRILVFGKKADWPDPESEVRKQAEGVDPGLERAVSALLVNLVDAWTWRNLALRNVDKGKVREVFNMRDFHGHSSDGQSYPYQVDDVARDLDEPSLYYAAQKTVQAAQDAAVSLQKLVNADPGKFSKVSINFMTPLGRVVVAGTGNDSHAFEDAAILIDLGGNDTYRGSVGATPSLDVPVAVAIDLSGDDVYRAGSGRTLSQGAGAFGAGVLIDLSGKDTYEAVQASQGYGLFGLGMLLDLEGDDKYTLEYSGQGAGYFGIGLLLDAAGNDVAYLYGDGQGFGGTGGVGVLADAAGDDSFTAEPLAEKAGRPDYHSQNKISVSQAQGCGAGMRADGSHGHAWAGGLGALIDLQGNDRYESGNWSLGTGYWYGTGLVYDGGGNDIYRSVYFTQASGAHFAIGAIFDEGGDDQHLLYETGGAGLAFGWDFTVALLFDKGGNDVYEAQRISIGNAQIRSNALLIDIGGDDTYTMPPRAEGFGAATFRKSYAAPSYKYGPYSLYGNSIGLLLDIGGKDQYLEKATKTGKAKPLDRTGNDRTWFKPDKTDPNFGYRSFGIGTDVSSGTVPDLYLGKGP